MVWRVGSCWDELHDGGLDGSSGERCADKRADEGLTLRNFVVHVYFCILGDTCPAVARLC